MFETDFLRRRRVRVYTRPRKNLFQTKRCPNGGDEEDRTPDPLLARQVLSQLSYTPIFLNVIGFA